MKFQVWSGGSLSVGINTVEEILHNDNPYILIQTNLFFGFLNQQEEEFHLTAFQKMTYALLIRRLIGNSKPALHILICTKVGQEENEWIAHYMLKIRTIPIHIHSIWNPNLDLIITDHALSVALIPENLDHYFMWSPFPQPLEWTKLLPKTRKIILWQVFTFLILIYLKKSLVILNSFHRIDGSVVNFHLGANLV